MYVHLCSMYVLVVIKGLGQMAILTFRLQIPGIYYSYYILFRHIVLHKLLWKVIRWDSGELSSYINTCSLFVVLVWNAFAKFKAALFSLFISILWCNGIRWFTFSFYSEPTFLNSEMYYVHRKSVLISSNFWILGLSLFLRSNNVSTNIAGKGKICYIFCRFWLLFLGDIFCYSILAKCKTNDGSFVKFFGQK